MNIYKTILHAIIKPVLSHDKKQLAEVVTRLKQTDGESWAVGEMLERVLRYIEATLALIEEVNKMQCYVVENNGHYSIECTTTETAEAGGGSGGLTKHLGQKRRDR